MSEAQASRKEELINKCIDSLTELQKLFQSDAERLWLLRYDASSSGEVSKKTIQGYSDALFKSEESERRIKSYISNLRAM